MLSRISLVALTVGCVLSPRAGFTQPAVDAAADHFARSISVYLALRERAVSSLPDLTVTSDPSRLERAALDLANAIRAARSTARQGDLFSADVANAFRQRLSAAMRRHAHTATSVIAKIDDDVTRTKDRFLVVNGRFVWNRGSEMPVELLDALPDLPAGLEYSFVDRNLVLVDVGADLIVDVLPDALGDQ
jgi:hypothetical protein